MTSSWRLSPNHLTVLESRLAEYNLHIYGCTNSSDSNQRGIEIWNWITRYNSDNHATPIGFSRVEPPFFDTKIFFGDFLIIDDEYFDINLYFDNKNVVICNPKKGFTKLKYWEAIDKFECIQDEKGDI